MATATSTSNILFSKWGLLALAFLAIYIGGGFDIITNNPSVIVFIILIILMIAYFKRGR